MVVDNYSCHIDITSLGTTNSRGVTQKLKTVFAQHRMLKCLVSDSGTQFSSLQNVDSFLRNMGFSTQQIILMFSKQMENYYKSTLNRNEDLLMTFLVYYSTTSGNGLSPVKLLIGCKLSTTVPRALYQPKLPNQIRLREKEGEIRRRQQNNFDDCQKSKTPRITSTQ